MMFIVRHEAYHDALWTAWLDSVNGLLPAAAVQQACCGRGRGRWLQRQQRRQKSRRRSALVSRMLWWRHGPSDGASPGHAQHYTGMNTAVEQPCSRFAPAPG